MNNKNRPFGLTVVDLAITVVVIAIIASAGFWAARVADGVIDRYAAGEAAKMIGRIDARIAARAAEAAVTRRVAAMKAHADEGERKLQTDVSCVEYSWAFKDARRKEEAASRAQAAEQAERDERFEALMRKKASALAAEEALLFSARLKAERDQRRQVALGLTVIGQVAEGMGKAQAAGFKASFLRQFGVQLQVVGMELTGAHSANPMLATAEGFLIGL